MMTLGSASICPTVKRPLGCMCGKGTGQGPQLRTMYVYCLRHCLQQQSALVEAATLTAIAAEASMAAIVGR